MLFQVAIGTKGHEILKGAIILLAPSNLVAGL